MTDDPWKCPWCDQMNSHWATECGRCDGKRLAAERSSAPEPVTGLATPEPDPCSCDEAMWLRGELVAAEARIAELLSAAGVAQDVEEGSDPVDAIRALSWRAACFNCFITSGTERRDAKVIAETMAEELRCVRRDWAIDAHGLRRANARIAELEAQIKGILAEHADLAYEREGAK